MSTAILGYGYDLGPRCEAIREIDGNGKLTLSWLPSAFVNHVDEEGECALVTAAQHRLLEPPANYGLEQAKWWRIAMEEHVGWIGLDDAVEEFNGVAFVRWGRVPDAPRWALLSHQVTASVREGRPVDLADLGRRQTEGGPLKRERPLDEPLAEALKALEFTPRQESPSWLLLSLAD